MHWFKHYSDFSRHPVAIALRNEMGMCGYSALLLVLERITAAYRYRKGMPSPVPSLTLTQKEWQKTTDFSPRKLQIFLDICENLEFFSIEKSEKTICIEAPILLSLLDESTRKILKKSGINPDEYRNPSKTKKQEEPEEIKRQNNSTFPISRTVESDIRRVLVKHGVSPDSRRGEYCMDYALGRARDNPAGYLVNIFAKNPNFGQEYADITQRQNTGPVSMGELMPSMLERMARNNS